MKDFFLSSLDATRRLFYVLSLLLNGLSAVAVAVVTVLVVLSSVMRYVLNQPLHFTEELCGLLFMCLSVLGLGYVAKKQQHVRLRVIFDRIPEPTRGYVDVAGNLITMAFLAALMKVTWGFAYETHQLGGASPDADILLFPWMAVIPLGLLVYELNLIIETIEKIQSIFLRKGV